MGLFNQFISLDIKNNMGIAGLTDEFFCVYLHNLFEKYNKNILVVVNSLYEANQLYSSLKNYSDNCCLFPMDDFLTSEAIATSPDLMVNRLETINSILDSKKCVVVTNLMGYLRFLPTVSTYKESIKTITVNQEYDQVEFASYLSSIGYKRESLVTKTGEFAVRGFIVDVFPLGSEHPVRFEFFGDTIDSIRSFDEDTQKSIDKVDNITIYPYI